MISIVVPVLDEEDEIGPALGALARLGSSPQFTVHGAPSSREGAPVTPHEVIVADGGSRDRTRERAAAAGARVLEAPRGRAAQMNAGAAAARGDVLVFLHVDTRLPDAGLAAIALAMDDAGTVGGGFHKRYAEGGWLLGASAWILNHVRTTLFKRMVGTQALFVRRDVFQRLGGFPPWPLLEDVGFCDRLRRAGRLRVVPLPATVSARRYRERGVLRQLAANALVLAFYRAGVGPERLVRLYRGASRRAPSASTG